MPFLLASKVSNQKSAVIQIIASLRVMCYISVVALKLLFVFTFQKCNYNVLAWISLGLSYFVFPQFPKSLRNLSFTKSGPFFSHYFFGLFFFLLYFLFRLPHGIWIRSELQLKPMPQLWQHHCARLGIKPVSQCSRHATNIIEPCQELPKVIFDYSI